MTAPQLILKYQKLTCGWNNEQQKSFKLLKEQNQTEFTEICLKCVVMTLCKWVVFGDGKSKFHPTTCHEGTGGEHMYSAALS
jgi:hypothetical protein